MATNLIILLWLAADICYLLLAEKKNAQAFFAIQVVAVGLLIG